MEEEAAWPFLHPDSMLACSGQLFSCSWCELHPARLSLAACLTHSTESTHTQLLWFCQTGLSRSSKTGVPPCYYYHYWKRKRAATVRIWLVVALKKQFVSYGFKLCSLADPPHQEQTRLFEKQALQTFGSCRLTFIFIQTWYTLTLFENPIQQ